MTPENRSFKPNAWSITRALMYERYQRSLCFQNYTPPEWWECDLFELTKAGYFREYEVKLTKSDFKADCLKERNRFSHDGISFQQRIESKHAQLSARNPMGPKQFWYVAPEGLLNPSEIPEWSGFIECHKSRNTMGMSFREIKPAPTLHNVPMEEKRIAGIYKSAYWRMCNLILFRKITPQEFDDEPAM